MIVSHRIQLDPTSAQRAYFAQAAGTSRFIYNRALEAWNAAYAQGKKPNGFMLQKEFNKTKYTRFPWLRNICAHVQMHPFLDLQDAFVRFFRHTSARPKFKRRHSHRSSFYVPNNTTLRFQDGHVQIPKVGQIRIKEQLRFSGRVRGATVLCVADRWFISVRVDVGENCRRKRTGNAVVGVDLGLTSFATFSDGEKVLAPKPLKASLKRLARLNRRLHRKQKGSKNRDKARKRLAKLHYRITCSRHDFLHKLTTRLCRENQTVVIEDLNVEGMKKHRSFARTVSDVGFYEFRRQLTYKAQLHRTKLVIADRWFPSSKTCSRCGKVKKTLSLSTRRFRCSCGASLDRDVNAAINLRRLGSSRSYASGQGSTGSQAIVNETTLDERGTGRTSRDGTECPANSASVHNTSPYAFRTP